MTQRLCRHLDQQRFRDVQEVIGCGEAGFREDRTRCGLRNSHQLPGPAGGVVVGSPQGRLRVYVHMHVYRSGCPAATELERPAFESYGGSGPLVALYRPVHRHLRGPSDAVQQDEVPPQRVPS